MSIWSRFKKKAEPVKVKAHILYECPPGEEITGIVRWRYALIMSTTRGVYKIEHDDRTEIRISMVEQ